MKAKRQLATKTNHLQSDSVNQIFKALADPRLISLAGGSPSPELFPLDEWSRIATKCIAEQGTKLFSYAATQGLPALRSILAKQLSLHGLDIHADDLVITNGAQSAIELALSILVNPGDGVLVEAPTFLGTLKTLQLVEAQVFQAPIRNKGIDVEEIEQQLQNHPEIKVLYLIPNFQNPSGVSLSLQKRKQIAQLLDTYNLTLIEDDPYRFLRYQGNDLPSIHSLNPDRVIYIGSLSKVFSPGMRLGYAVANKKLISMLIAAKQASDVHTNNLAQAMAAEFLSSPSYITYLDTMKNTYSSRLQTMLSELEQHFQSTFMWTKPDGGMFVWVAGPKSFDATKLYSKAIDAGVAYVPGAFFYAHEDIHNNLRLNFTNASSIEIRKGIEILAGLLD